jgi:hypothetical protein
MHWFHKTKPPHPHKQNVWLVVNSIAMFLHPNKENFMAQNLHIDQIDNLSIAATDAAGNPQTPTFDSPPSWTLNDPASSGATLVASADGLTAVLTPPATPGASVTVNLTGVIGGQNYSATLSVTFVAGAIASISIVAVAAPRPPSTTTTAPAPTPAPAPAP